MDIIYKHETSQNITPNFFSVHTHSCCEIFLMLRGAGSFVVEGHKYPLPPNSMVILRPGEMHRAEIETERVYERCFLHFSEESIAALDSSGNFLRPFNDRLIGQNNFYGAGDIDIAFIKGLLLKAENMTAHSDGGDDFLSHYLYIILQEIYSSFQAKNTLAAPRQDYDALIYEIIQYINKNICSELSAGEIERLFFISRPALNKRFKLATGTTVWNYIITKRIVYANQLIAAGESATQAAYACGYNDYSSFYRAYCKIFNHHPQR